MPNYDSPLGNKKFSGQPLKEFDVPDGDEPRVTHYGSPPPQTGGRPSGPPGMPDLSAAFAFQQQISDDDDDGQMADMDRQMREAREAKRTGKTRLNEGAKRRIEMLVGMSRTTREATIGGNKYALQTLSSKEMRSAIMTASNFDGTVQSPFEVRRQLLGHSVTHVAGLDIVQFVGTNDLQAKLELIDSLDEALLNRLYDEYLLMVQEAREKYVIKSDVDAQEVVEDLKK